MENGDILWKKKLGNLKSINAKPWVNAEREKNISRLIRGGKKEYLQRAAHDCIWVMPKSFENGFTSFTFK